MKKPVKFKINPNDVLKRNELHFNIQRKYRVQLSKNMKVYNRKRLPKVDF